MDRFGGAIFPQCLEPPINSRDFPALSEQFSAIFQLNPPIRLEPPIRSLKSAKKERERETCTNLSYAEMR